MSDDTSRPALLAAAEKTGKELDAIAARMKEEKRRIAAFEPGGLVERMEATLRALSSNPHLDLGDLVYKVREAEGEGWEGPSVKAWSEAVTGARALLAELDGVTGTGSTTEGT